MRPIDADVVIEKYGDWYVEEGSEEGFIGTLKSLIDEQPTVSRWISVKDGLPEEDGLYTVYCKNGSMAHAWFEDNKWFIDHCECGTGYVTNWMPLPEPPKDGDGNAR